MHFSYSNPTQIVFGQGQIATIAELIDNSHKVLLVFGGGSIKHNGVYEQVTKALANNTWVEFSGVEPNPTIETLNKAVDLAREEKIDFILAVGGGSVIDGSKYIAAATLYDGDGWDLICGKQRTTQAIPLGAVLTLPATGSESNSGAVISRSTTKEKLPLFSYVLFPKFAIMDPDCMQTLPQEQIANGIIDAFVHACEQYITFPASGGVQDGYAETLLRNLIDLANNIHNKDTNEWRSNLMWTANQSLNGLIGVGVPVDWATHMIGHEITAVFGIAHARSLAAVHTSLLKNQINNKREKLEQMGRNVFNLENSPQLADATIEKIEELYNSLDVKTSYTDYTCTKEEAINKILALLEQHGMVALGERQSINLETSKTILKMAL